MPKDEYNRILSEFKGISQITASLTSIIPTKFHDIPDMINNHLLDTIGGIVLANELTVVITRLLFY